MRILVLGASGMLGNAMIQVLNEKTDWEVRGTVRSESAKPLFPPEIAKYLISGVDVEQQDSLLQTFNQVRPNVVINCVGVVKQLVDSDDPLRAIPINALLPHRLARMCEMVGARLVHMSTDCVFAGDRGNYRESDPSDAKDLYGRSKYLGEVAYPHAVTLRTSIIGHELKSAHGLIDWFLSQNRGCNGYAKAIFSGLPTVVLAQIVRDVVIQHPDLSGVYHVAAKSISKYDLLKLVSAVYGKTTQIIPCDQMVIDRSLDAGRFRDATGYIAPEWSELIQTMHSYYKSLQK